MHSYRRLLYAGAASLCALSCKSESYEYRPPEKAETAPALPPRMPAPPLAEPPKAADASEMEGKEPDPAESSGPREETAPGCPEGMAGIGSFCMDRFEGILVDAGGKRFPRNMHPPEDMSGLKAVSVRDAGPQGHLSQDQADKACLNAGKRLCTSDEWERACRGPAGNAFPYGPVSDPSRCNLGKRIHILDKYFPDIPHLRRAGNEFNDPLLLLDPEYQARTGRMGGCVSPEGVYDLDGNMSEWVSDRVVRPGDPRVYGVFRGAPFSGGAHEGCARKTTGHDAKYYDYSLGARCCASKHL